MTIVPGLWALKRVFRIFCPLSRVLRQILQTFKMPMLWKSRPPLPLQPQPTIMMTMMEMCQIWTTSRSTTIS